MTDHGRELNHDNNSPNICNTSIKPKSREETYAPKQSKAKFEFNFLGI
jgi:hypothetical protein